MRTVIASSPPASSVSAASSSPSACRGRRGAVLLLKMRPRSLPGYWRMVDDGKPARTWVQQDHWAMVLSARGIPYMQTKRGQRALFYVPLVYEALARTELHDFSVEGRAKVLAPPQPMHPWGHWAVLLPLGLLLWHGLRVGWWDAAAQWPLPAQQWKALGALDTLRVHVYQEWYRCLTALTLHADTSHVLGNVAFGSLFITLLCRAQGLGLGLLITILGGAWGNVFNVLVRPEPLISLGFSTALFAAVGGLSGSRMLQGEKGRALVPLAAGAAVLAMLGTGGENTDYVAHVAGLLSGILLGLLAQGLQRRCGCAVWGQWVAGFAAVGLLCGAWLTVWLIYVRS